MRAAEPAAAVRVFVGLGANVGDPPAVVAAALRELAALPHTQLMAASPVYRTAPVDAHGPDFFNAVAELRTRLAAADLLRELQTIEQAHGRQRPYRNAPRTLDLDLLLYGDVVIDEPGLTVPHPRMHRRAFVLKPLVDLAPEIAIPHRGAVAALLAMVADQVVERVASRPIGA